MSDHSSPGPDPAASRTPYERLGGRPTIAHVVAVFYRRVLADELLAGYFTGADMDRLRHHQIALLTRVLDGPDQYTGLDLAAAHAGRGITDAAFRRVGDHLVAVLAEQGADDDVIAQVVHTLTGVRDQIVTADDTDDDVGARSAWVPSWSGPTPPAGVRQL